MFLKSISKKKKRAFCLKQNNHYIKQQQNWVKKFLFHGVRLEKVESALKKTGSFQLQSVFFHRSVVFFYIPEKRKD